MRVDILTLFPEMFSGYLSSSIMDKARTLQLLDVHLHNIRDYAEGKHRITDEPPYGGGGGMVLKPEPIFAAVESLIGESKKNHPGAGASGLDAEASDEKKEQQSSVPIILLTPQGHPFSQEIALELSGNERLILICGRYEGVDERVREHLATDELSMGDYIMTGGELAAMVVVDAVTRLIPGVLGAEGAAESDSFADGLLEGPHYSRPQNFRGWTVPEILRSGHAAEIQRWRRHQALRRTWRRRPDLLIEADLSEDDKYYLMVLAEERIDEISDRPADNLR
ncbi:MAG: tRNA (guanosine(37)-N1)-methyltransferase TrmD [Candidatus Promineifilaceae bacterium]